MANYDYHNFELLKLPPGLSPIKLPFVKFCYCYKMQLLSIMIQTNV